MWRNFCIGFIALVATSGMSAQAATLQIFGPGGSAVINPGFDYEFTDLISPVGVLAAPALDEFDDPITNQEGQFVLLDVYNLFVVGDGVGPMQRSFQFSALNSTGGTDPVGLGDLTFTLFDTTNSQTLTQVILTDGTGALIPSVLSSFILPVGITDLLSLELTITGTILQPGSTYNVEISTVPLPLPFGMLIASMAGLLVLRRMRSAA